MLKPEIPIHFPLSAGVRKFTAVGMTRSVNARSPRAHINYTPPSPLPPRVNGSYNSCSKNKTNKVHCTKKRPTHRPRIQRPPRPGVPLSRARRFPRHAHVDRDSVRRRLQASSLFNKLARGGRGQGLYRQLIRTSQSLDNSPGAPQGAKQIADCNLRHLCTKLNEEPQRKGGGWHQHQV